MSTPGLESAVLDVYRARILDEDQEMLAHFDAMTALVHESPARGRPVSRASRRMGWMGHDLA